ncbi:hypothetical protein [Micromonospora sp. NPDC005206]
MAWDAATTALRARAACTARSRRILDQRGLTDRQIHAEQEAPQR